MKVKSGRRARPARPFPDDLDEIIREYGRRARVVQLWRRVDSAQNQWTHLGRLSPAECELGLLAERFGGGSYRAKILGAWDPVRRQEEYLEQVTFGIARPLRRITG